MSPTPRFALPTSALSLLLVVIACGDDEGRGGRDPRNDAGSDADAGASGATGGRGGDKGSSGGTPASDGGAGGRAAGGAGGSATGGSPPTSGGAGGRNTAGSGGTTPGDAATGGADGGAGPAEAGADAGADAAPDPDASGATLIRVHYPAATHSLALRGSLAPFDGAAGVVLQPVDATTSQIAIDDLGGELEFRPYLDDTAAAKGPSWHVSPGETVDVYPRFVTDEGTWSRYFTDVSSTILGNTRGVWIYLPPTYVENTAFRAPVLYMHDGQDLFDPDFAFGGVTWRVPEALDAGAADGSIAEALVVGVENTRSRIDEYTPSVDQTMADGGGAASYLRFLVEELKPRVDAAFRTRPERESTAMVGSSLGGLFTAYAGATRSDVFGRIGAMSPSTWWNDREILGIVGAMSPAPARPLAVYLDSGDQNDGHADTAELAATYRTAGYVDGVDLRYVLQAGGRHDAASWAARLPGALAFLLGPERR